MKKTPLLLFCVILFLLGACSSKHQNEQLGEAERLLVVAPDSALCIIDSLLARYPELSDAEKAYLGILYYEAVSKTVEGCPAFELIDNSIQYYRAETDKVRRNNRLIVVIATIILLTSAYLGVYLYRKWKKHNAEKEEQFAKKTEEHTKTEKLLKNRQKILTHQELLGRVHQLQEAQVAERKKMTLAQKEQADIEIYKQVLQYDKEMLFFEKINHFFNRFVDVLKHDYPTLNIHDKVYCCLLLVGLKFSEIALILGVKEDSARKRKQRIARKMGFDSVDELDGYLSGFG
jgi:uncharacterized protein YcfL